jgi:hypothetical protein
VSFFSSSVSCDCLTLFLRAVRCDKGTPCSRCLRRGTVCTTQPRKRARQRDDNTWAGDETFEEDFQKQSRDNHAQSRGGSFTSAKEEPQSYFQDDLSVIEEVNFLLLTREWLLVNPVLMPETSRVAVVIQSFIQYSTENRDALEVALQVSSALHIDGAERLRWIQGRCQAYPLGDPSIDTFVLDLRHMKLPPFIEVLSRVDGLPTFIYSYHNGHQSFAANEFW